MRTHLQTLPLCVGCHVLHNQAHVGHHDEHGKVDLQPVLSFALVNFIPQPLEKARAKRLNEVTDDHVVQLGVHDWCHRREPIEGVASLIYMLQAYHGATVVHPPLRLDQARRNPDVQGIRNEFCLQNMILANLRKLH